MAAVMFQVSQAILPAAGVIAPVVPPVVPPMLAGVPFGGLGFGLGLGLGFPFLGGLAFSRLALLGLLGRKKRDVTPIARKFKYIKTYYRLIVNLSEIFHYSSI